MIFRFGLPSGMHENEFGQKNDARHALGKSWCKRAVPEQCPNNARTITRQKRPKKEKHVKKQHI